jgi:hypothetical protein
VASEIAHAVAPDPFSPFRFTGTVLGDIGEGHWGGRMAHNPAVIRWGGRWWMFHIGGTYRGPRPDAATLAGPGWERYGAHYQSIRIGCAVADRPEGPWTRCDRPVIGPELVPWPSRVATNPAPYLTPDGRIRVVYRSPRRDPGGVRNVLVVAEAEHPLGPYRLVRPEPLFPAEVHLEDPHVWWNGEVYEMVAKDLDGTTCGLLQGGVHLWSADGLDWRVMDPARAWDLRLTGTDGSVRPVGNIDRPSLLRDRDGTLIALSVATVDSAADFDGASASWNVLIPLG